MTFYLLSLFTGILECGWIAYGAIHSLPLWQILCYPLAYHLGNLFPKPFSLSRRCLTAMSISAFVTSGLTITTYRSDLIGFLFTCVSLFLLSAVFQSVRSELKSAGNRLAKRIFRVGGFALAPLAAFFPSCALLISSAVALWGLKDYTGKCRISRLSWQKGFSLVMVFHQLHYFFYAHITLAVVSLSLTAKYTLGTVCATVLFCGTWITYMSVEPIISRLTPKVTPIFHAGHIGICILLFVMHLATRTSLFAILWLATGFGGGVVYTITAKAKINGAYDKTSMTISENIGHTFGLLTAVCVAALMPEQSLDIMLVLGSISAMLAVISMFLITRKENRYEHIHGKS